LPINSPVKETITTHIALPSKSLALMAVALEVLLNSYGFSTVHMFRDANVYINGKNSTTI
jgi:hypothetical protein